MSNTTIDHGHDRGEPLTEPSSTVPAPPLTGFAAGITGAALLVAGVWGLHVLTPGGNLSVGAVALLLAAFTALGKGITLIQRAVAPITAAATMAMSGIPALVRAITGVVVGAAGIWWVLRGHAALWWAHSTGTAAGWTLLSALVQVGIIATAGALLFGGATTLASALGLTTSARRGADRWASWWSSRPGLGLMLLAGAAALVALSGYLVPRVSDWLLGGDPNAALAAITAILILGLLANTWWWGALSGWWAWAHRPHAPGSGTTPMGQMYAGAGVVALLWFSATAFGLAVPDSYSGPGAMPRARADCPPDCGGGSGSGSSGPDPSQFQPPQMPDPPGQYQGGANSGYPGPDQANGISIYNPATGQGGPAQGGYPQYPSQGQPGPPANGVQPPNYDAPLQGPAPQQASPGGQQPPAGPQQAPGEQPAQAPQQPAQPSQGQPQPGQPSQPPEQGQPSQQQPQNPTNEHSNQQVQQQPQNQKPSTPQKEPNTPVDPTDLAAAATRRGSQQAGQQAAQQGAQATQQATQQSTQATQQASQAGERGVEKAAEPGDQFPADFHMGQLGDGLTARAEYSPTGAHWGDNAKSVGALTKETAETLAKAGKRFTNIGRVLEAGQAAAELANGAPVPETVGKTAGSLLGAWGGAEAGALAGAAIGSFLPGPGNVVGAVVGGVVGGFLGSGFGSAAGEALGGAARSAGSALSSAASAVGDFLGW
jgi:hypothetical protein